MINRQRKRYDKLANISFLLLFGVVGTEYAKHIGFLADLLLRLLGSLIVFLHWVGAKSAQELSYIRYIN